MTPPPHSDFLLPLNVLPPPPLTPAIALHFYCEIQFPGAENVRFLLPSNDPFFLWQEQEPSAPSHVLANCQVHHLAQRVRLCCCLMTRRTRNVFLLPLGLQQQLPLTLNEVQPFTVAPSVSRLCRQCWILSQGQLYLSSDRWSILLFAHDFPPPHALLLRSYTPNSM